MSEVSYYVALPFVASEDGIAPADAVECFNPNAAVMRACWSIRRRASSLAQLEPLAFDP